MSSPISLICLDFDGTIMSYDEPPGFFHPEAIGLLNDLRARGITWCTNSGRDVDGQVEIIEKSCEKGLEHLPAALLCAESYIYRRHGDDYSDMEPWNSRVRQRARDFHALVQESLAPELDALVEKYQPERVYMEEEATVFLVANEDDRPSRLLADLASIVGRVPHGMATRNGGWVVALPDDLGKGNLLRAYMEAAELDASRALAIGDHINDLNMLDGTAARHVGCPGDAVPEVTQAVRAAGGYVASREGPLGTVEVVGHFLDGA